METVIAKQNSYVEIRVDVVNLLPLQMAIIVALILYFIENYSINLNVPPIISYQIPRKTKNQ